MSVDAGDFDYIAQLVWRRSAIVLEPGKEYLVESRLTPIVRRTGGEAISDLVGRIPQRTADQAPAGAVRVRVSFSVVPVPAGDGLEPG